MRTDIKGAAAAKIDSVFVASGIHLAGGDVTKQALAELFPDTAVQPLAAMTSLAW